MHNPPLDKFALLPSIAAVDDAFGGLHQSLDGVELFFVAIIIDEFDAETIGNHGQGVETPRFPPWGVVVGFFEGAEVALGPCYLVAVALHVAVVARGSTQNAGNIASNRRFFGNADYHDETEW